LRRSFVCPQDQFKAACKQPKVENPLKKKSRKNIFTNKLGEKKGKVYIQQQELDTLATRKFKKRREENVDI